MLLYAYKSISLIYITTYKLFKSFYTELLKDSGQPNLRLKITLKVLF